MVENRMVSRPAGKAVLWRRLDRPGHETARFIYEIPSWHLTGTAVFVHDRQPCRLDYFITCDDQWQTRMGRVTGWVGERLIEIEISVDPAGRWSLNGTERPEVRGCLDIDLNFSPSTNLLPIRRLRLALGDEAEVRAAWLRFPGFTLEPLDQRYRRTGPTAYRYESAGGRFVAELQVNAEGFVTDYPNLWELETAT